MADKKLNNKNDQDAVKTYYAGMADAVRYIENAIKSGLSLKDSLGALKKEVTERREKLQGTRQLND